MTRSWRMQIEKKEEEDGSRQAKRHGRKFRGTGDISLALENRCYDCHRSRNVTQPANEILRNAVERLCRLRFASDPRRWSEKTSVPRGRKRGRRSMGSPARGTKSEGHMQSHG
ncbi:hypothetical protein QLX08_011064 [Tetragonisca angustula]|uniref:Uncharacterized protein n=1 Tax=Tetragonisca angustula TaxID=166442 RepID=A0AAW0ZAK6_9HYME